MKKFLILFFIFLTFPYFVFSQNKIEINHASLLELENIISVGPSTAQKIIDARPFSSVDDLLRVKGIGEKTLQKIKEQGLAFVKNENLKEIENSDKITPKENLKEDIPKTNTIVFSEIMPAPSGSDEENEWIEIYNTSDQEVDLTDWRIQDSTGSAGNYSLKKTVINPHQYLAFGRPETHIILNNEGDLLSLLDNHSVVIDSVNYQKAKSNQSFAKNGEIWNWTTTPTPGAVNITNQYLPKIKKPAKNIAVASLVDSLPQAPENPIQKLEEPKPYNPWFLFFFAFAIAGISGSIILFLKIRFQNKTNNNYHERSFPF